MSKTVFVTGAGGFIGSHLCETLVESGYTVKALAHYNSASKSGWLDAVEPRARRDIEIFSGDVTDFHMLNRTVKGCDTIFHLAALIGIPYSYIAPQSYVNTNVQGTLNVLQAALNHSAKVIHTSTSETYGTAQFVPITEKHPINPQSPYAATKAAADFLALSYNKAFGLPVTVIRPFNTYGPRQSARAIIPTIITQLLAGDGPLKLGATHTTRDLNFVKDTARGFLLAARTKKGEGEVINLGSNKEITIKDLALLIGELCGKKVRIKTDAARLRPGKSEVERLWADNAKAKKLLGWTPRRSLRDGLAETIDWLRENRRLYRPETYHV